MFDAATGQVIRLADAPEVLEGFALCATAETLFAVKGNTAYLGRFVEMTQGVVVGHIFEGLSISATDSVFLVNDRETIEVGKGGWHKAQGDYTVCVSPEGEVFGQIVNV